MIMGEVVNPESPELARKNKKRMQTVLSVFCGSLADSHTTILQARQKKTRSLLLMEANP